jgi:hypothetical protein
VLDLEEVDDLLDLEPVLDLLVARRAELSTCQKKFLCIFSVRPDMMLSSVDMPLNSATFWKVRAMPWPPPHRAASASGPSPLEGDHPDLRMIEPVDHVEHRGLAGPVGADDGADLTLVNVEETSEIAFTPPNDSDTFSSSSITSGWQTSPSASAVNSTC